MDIIESSHFFELSERAQEEDVDDDEEDDSKNLKLNMDAFSTIRLDT